MTKSQNRRIFLETSGVVYELHGERRMRAEVRNATKDGRVEASNFIRMEYLRGFISNLIELYFLIREEESVSDALIVWSQSKVRQERKLKVVLMTIPQWLTSQDEWQAKEKSLRRLGEYIVRQTREFDEFYSRRSKDDLKCELGRVSFPTKGFDEGLLLDFYERFSSIRSGVPACELCAFRQRKQRSLTRAGLDLYGPEQRQKYKSTKKFSGYSVQAERLEQAAATDATRPKCRWCERLGDSIIALHSPAKAILVTADKAFVAFGEILDRDVRLLRSLAVLKKLEKQ